MKIWIRTSLLTCAGTGLLLSGCAAPQKTAGKTHFMYLPEETGSHLHRAILVDESGNPVSGDGSSDVHTYKAESMRKAQDNGTSRNRGG